MALAALLVRYAFPVLIAGFSDGLLGMIWRTALILLWPFSVIATWIDPYLRPLPEWVDLLGTFLLGLLPYAIADVGYRRMITKTSKSK